MEKLAIALLGPFQVTRNGIPVTEFETDLTRALLAYLAMHAGIPFRRETLADLLWPDQPASKALGALRKTLSRLRSAIKDQAVADPFLEVTRHTIQFNPDNDYWLDVTAFEDLIAASKQHPHRRLESCRLCIQKLQEAAELYRNDLLTGLNVNSLPFQEWLTAQGEYLHHQVMEILHQLAAHYEQRGAYDRANHYAWRQVGTEPWCEEAHQQLMRALASSGQRSAALAQYEACRRSLAEELGIAPSAETTRLYEQIRSGDLEHGRKPRHNLPMQPTPFVGREAELAQIADRLNHVDCRLLTLVGPGGIGKTRLALQAASNEIGMFRDGLFIVPLTAASSPDHMGTALAQAMQFSFYGRANPQAQLLDYLREKELLLVLDNFEHLLSGQPPVTLASEEDKGKSIGMKNTSAIGLLVEILKTAPGIKLLVTSRERLNLQWEWLLEIQGLTFPKDSVADAVEAYSAVQLFFQSACRIQPGFRLATDKPDVVRLCQILEGMPLGIEMAAAWTQAFSCHELAIRIERNLNSLASSLWDMPERHRSLQAVFDYSWNLLSDEEKSVLSKLSVFRGGFQAEAAERVAGASPSLLLALEYKSFLRRHPALERYEMLEVVRQYAEEKLQQSPGEKDETHNLHCEYYAEFLYLREEHLQGERQTEALQAIDNEIGNVRAGWQWAVGRGRDRIINESLESLYRFYEIRSWFQEGEETFEKATDGLGGVNPVLKEIDKEKSALLGRILARQGRFSSRLSNFGKAQELLQASLDILGRLGARREMAFPLHKLGLIVYMSGRNTEARRLFHESLTIYRENHDQEGIATCLVGLGTVAGLEGEFKEKMKFFDESLAIYKRLGDRRGMANCLCDLGLLALDLGASTEAKRLLQESLAISKGLGDRWLMACCLGNLGNVAQVLEEWSEAQQHYQESLAIFKETGHRAGTAGNLINLGCIAEASGEYGKARQLYQESVAIFKEIGFQHGMAQALNNLGSAFCALGKYHESIDCFREGLEVAAAIQATSEIVAILIGIATLLAKKSEPEQAVELIAHTLLHPAIKTDAKGKAERLLSTLESQLAPQVFAGAMDKGRSRDLEYFVRFYGAS